MPATLSTPPAATHPCPVCGSVDCPRFEVATVGVFRRCEACEFIFAPETDSEDAVLYDESFGASNIHPTYRKTGNGYVIKNAPKLSRLLDYFEAYRRQGRILDIGCSAAFFMHLAQQRGWKASGVEIAPWAAEFSNRELGVDVFCGTLQEAKFESDTFDVVFSSHVLEHISDPAALVTEMVRVLRPGGLHVSVLPSQFASPSWRLGRRFIGDPPPKHSSFFNRESFLTLMERCGLHVESCRYNVELMRLYELSLNQEQLRERWKTKVSANAADAPAPVSSPTKELLINNAKRLVNQAGNFLGMGDEIICFATKPI